MKREALILALLYMSPAFAQSTDNATQTPEQSLVERHKRQFQIANQVQQDPMAKAETVKVVDESNLAKPGECTWKTVWQGTKQNVKRFGYGCKLYRAQVWKDNWNDGWAFLIRNDRKIGVTTNSILGANQAKELF